MQVIQRLTVVSNPTRVFEVGTEIDGQEIIEIEDDGVRLENSVHSEYLILGNDNQLIASIENAPVILDFKQIVEHGEPEKCFYCEKKSATRVRFGKPSCITCGEEEIRSSAPGHKMSEEQKANHLKIGIQAFKLAFSENVK